MEKVLTVVVPTYNMEKYLDRCLSSLIIEDDKMDMLEVLVINDGSKDRSSEIAHGYETRYPQTFRVIDKENGNYGSCVNRGMDEATGKYFRILDADDWFDTGELSRFVGILNSVNSEIVFSKYTLYDGNNYHLTGFPDFIDLEREYCLAVSEDASDILNGCETPLFFVRMHQMTVLLDLIRRHPFKLVIGVSYTDAQFCYALLRWSKSFIFEDINLYQYYLAREGQTMAKDVRAKSLKAMEIVASWMLEDYLTLPDNTNKQLCFMPLRSSLYIFYQTGLFYCDYSTAKPYLDRVDSLVCKDTYLQKRTCEWIYRRIRYVNLWRKTGLSFTNPIMKTYDSLWDFCRKLKNGVSK